MYIKNDTIGVIFRVLFLIVCGAGLVMKLFAHTGRLRIAGQCAGTGVFRLFDHRQTVL